MHFGESAGAPIRSVLCGLQGKDWGRLSETYDVGDVLLQYVWGAWESSSTWISASARPDSPWSLNAWPHAAWFAAVASILSHCSFKLFLDFRETDEAIVSFCWRAHSNIICQQSSMHFAAMRASLGWPQQKLWPSLQGCLSWLKCNMSGVCPIPLSGSLAVARLGNFLGCGCSASCSIVSVCCCRLVSWALLVQISQNKMWSHFCITCRNDRFCHHSLQEFL